MKAIIALLVQCKGCWRTGRMCGKRIPKGFNELWTGLYCGTCSGRDGVDYPKSKH